MFKHSLILVVVLSVLLAGCSALPAGNMTRGSGKYATRDYPLDGFTGILACCGMKVTVTGGSSFKVSVTTDDNLLDAIAVKKEGETLRIELDKSKLNVISTTRLEAAVTMPMLQAVTLDGGARLNAAQPAPQAPNLTMSANGGSQADLSAMTAQKASVKLDGGARANVRVTGTLDYDLNGGSQLQYTGKPTLGSQRMDGGARASEY